MTTPPASDGPQTLHADTIGAAWLAVAGRILADGVASRYDGLPVREISLVTLAVQRPSPDDEIIASHADPERLAWMHANFTDHARVRRARGAIQGAPAARDRPRNVLAGHGETKKPTRGLPGAIPYMSHLGFLGYMCHTPPPGSGLPCFTSTTSPTGR